MLRDLFYEAMSQGALERNFLYTGAGAAVFLMFERAWCGNKRAVVCFQECFSRSDRQESHKNVVYVLRETEAGRSPMDWAGLEGETVQGLPGNHFCRVLPIMSIVTGFDR
jgi:hypothetical protein